MSTFSTFYGLVMLCQHEDCPHKEHLLPPLAMDKRGLPEIIKMGKSIAIADKSTIKVVEFSVNKVLETIIGGH